MPGPEGFPAGWYDDPDVDGARRYYDGEKWTDQFTPPPDKQVSEKEGATGTIIVGYVLAVLMPLIGFIIGLTQINRSTHGKWVVVASCVAFIVWLIIIGAAASNEAANTCTGYYC